MNRPALEAIGDLVDIVAVGDDVGMQDRAICSLNSYRQMIRPYQGAHRGRHREHTQAKILYHTCGCESTATFRISSGKSDNWNRGVGGAREARGAKAPPRARKIGGRIAVWGGIDSQRLLPRGTQQKCAVSAACSRR